MRNISISLGLISVFINPTEIFIDPAESFLEAQIEGLQSFLTLKIH